MCQVIDRTKDGAITILDRGALVVDEPQDQLLERGTTVTGDAIPLAITGAVAVNQKGTPERRMSDFICI